MKRRIAVFCVTENGKSISSKIKAGLEDRYDIEQFIRVKGLKNCVADVFNEFDYIVFICATGIAVRMIAPFIRSKYEDPGVVVVDDRARHTISLLSGHLGGANRLTCEIAEILSSNPVITTATDVNEVAALDMIIKNLDLKYRSAVSYPDAVKNINSLLVNKKKVYLYIDNDVEKYFSEKGNHIDKRGFTEIDKIDMKKTPLVVISDKSDEKLEIDYEEYIIKLVPQTVKLGIGCKRNTSYEKIKSEAEEFLKENGIDLFSIGSINSIELKKDEKGLILFSEMLNVEFNTFSAEELSVFEDRFEKSEFVKKVTGVYSVAGPSVYMAGAKELLTSVSKKDGVTLCAGR